LIHGYYWVEKLVDHPSQLLKGKIVIRKKSTGEWTQKPLIKPKEDPPFIIVSPCHILWKQVENLATNTKKMSYFSGCNNLTMITNFISTVFIIFIITFQASMAKAENPLQEFSNREELVQLAGYGEEKLSTVLVTGTILCEACLNGGTQLLHAWPVSGCFFHVPH